MITGRYKDTITIAQSRLQTMKEEYKLWEFDNEKKKRQRLIKMVNKKYLHEPLVLHKKEMPKTRPGNEETKIFWKKINE